MFAAIEKRGSAGNQAQSKFVAAAEQYGHQDWPVNTKPNNVARKNEILFYYFIPV